MSAAKGRCFKSGCYSFQFAFGSEEKIDGRFFERIDQKLGIYLWVDETRLNEIKVKLGWVRLG